jgi:hypothetical protein
MDRPVANHSHVRLRYSEKPGDVRTGPLVVERHDDNRSFPFLERLQAAGELLMVELGQGRLGRREQIRTKLLEQARPALGASARRRCRRSS